MPNGPSNPDEQAFWDEAYDAALNGLAAGDGTDEEKAEHAGRLADLALQKRRDHQRG